MHGIVFSFVHAVIILAVSFFVLSYATKQEVQWLKTFGLAVAVLLWVSAALVFGKGVSAHDRGGREHSFYSGHKMWENGAGMRHMIPGKMNAPVEKTPAPDNSGAPQNTPSK